MYPHYLDVYVRRHGVLPLEEAIRKATALPAQRIGLADRGTLHPGAFADIVLFDPARIRECGDFEEPVRAPEGIAHVIVNGRVVTEGKKHLGVAAGKVLRKR
jgi:N-acyl-D-aspartate/D-glutamate deacylase